MSKALPLFNKNMSQLFSFFFFLKEKANMAQQLKFELTRMFICIKWLEPSSKILSRVAFLSTRKLFNNLLSAESDFGYNKILKKIGSPSIITISLKKKVHLLINLRKLIGKKVLQSGSTLQIVYVTRRV